MKMEHISTNRKLNEVHVDVNDNPVMFDISNNIAKNKFQSVLALAKIEYHNTVIQENEFHARKEELKRQEWKELTEKESLDRQEFDIKSESKTMTEYVQNQAKEVLLEKDKIREKIGRLKNVRKTEFDAVKINRMFYSCFDKEVSDFKKTFESKPEVKKV